MARKSLNITLEPGVYEEFCDYAGKKGIRASPWVNAKMKEFIEEEKEAEAEKEANKKRK
ncbi:MAG: uracil-DNA glycosylase [Desulfosporosinus sp. BRH_c37]|nr:MAG: uracil-DNA glycosylase [Desulfosporosinus sp. BRH_c37]